MSAEKLLKNAARIKILAEKLSEIEKVKILSKGDDNEPWALSIMLSEIEESFTEVLEERLPQICAASNEKLLDALLDLGEDFRHILYHLNESNFFSYIREDKKK